mgnify:FL=1
MTKTRGFEVVANAHRQHVQEAVVFGKVQVQYAEITLPIRADRRSAGYDMYLPQDVLLLPAQKIIIWSDVKAFMQEDEYVALHIRSSLGIKQGIILSNITGIVDSSYYNNPANDGNIGFALLNTSGKGVQLKAGERICQAIFQKYLLADNDNVLAEERLGGSGSSGK